MAAVTCFDDELDWRPAWPQRPATPRPAPALAGDWPEGEGAQTAASAVAAGHNRQATAPGEPLRLAEIAGTVPPRENERMFLPGAAWQA